MKYILYGHGGSGNHGCEAIVRTTLAMLSNKDVDVYSADVAKDDKFGITKLASFYPYQSKKDSALQYLFGKIIYKLFGNYSIINRFTFHQALKSKENICISVGGDNYCNAEPARHASRNKLFSVNNRTVLWGCSITPDLLKDSKYIEDMKRYSLITARESLTYNALVQAGISNVELVSDPAFTLEPQHIKLPELFSKREIVGLNISPLVMKYQQKNDILMKNIEVLVEEIVKGTDYGIVLIPHVLLENNNDLTPLRKLYKKYRHTEKICLVDNDDTLNCCEIKYIISKCKFMIAARTHASIAAYSSCVPTLVLGYSVKSQGIAIDIFGTAKNYVLPVDMIYNKTDIVNAFCWLMEHENDIRTIYKEKMKEYIEKAYQAGKYLREI